MGLDINLFRPEKGGNPDAIKESVKKRFQDPKIVDDVLALDEEWRKKRFICDQLRKERNAVNKAIGEKKKKDKADPCEEEVAAGKALDEKILAAQQEEEPILAQLEALVNKIGNIVHESVPIFKDEAQNEIIKTWGTIPNIKVTELPGKPGRAHHHEILHMIDGVEQDPRGIKVAGHRGYFLKGFGALLNMALYTYGVHFLTKKGYTFMQPPFFMKKSMMAKTAQLSDFDDQLYKVTGNKDEEDLYLIATAEQPLSCLYQGEWLDPKELPIKLAGLSSCFRKEAGAHGKETWGVFRVHQFEKVEQFCFTTPDKSWEMHEEMLKVSEEFYQSLKLPYKVISIVSGALNDAAAKKYDLEAWFPGYNDYRELVSCSNCTDYQARSLEIRCGQVKQNEKEKKYVHLLNGTLCATERTLSCILENYQEEKGVRVPEVLVPHVGVDFIPYVKPVPKFQNEKK